MITSTDGFQGPSFSSDQLQANSPRICWAICKKFSFWISKAIWMQTGFQCYACGYFNSKSRRLIIYLNYLNYLKKVSLCFTLWNINFNNNIESFFFLTKVKSCYSFHEKGTLKNQSGKGRCEKMAKKDVCYLLFKKRERKITPQVYALPRQPM